MKIFETRQIRDIDNYTILHEPVPSIELMERAAQACAKWIEEHIGREINLLIFTGPGNNGGDGLAIARILSHKGFQNISVYQLRIKDSLSQDAETNLKRIQNEKKIKLFEIQSESELPVISISDVVIDALFGTGLSRPLTDKPAQIVRHINAAGCKTIAIDMPSGLMGENNTGNIPDHIIRATCTLTFQFPKRAFLFSENEAFIGQWHILDIGLHPEAIKTTATPFQLINNPAELFSIRKRPKFSHKGTFGHALLIAGSYGMMGAAILASRACLKSGVGLLTTHVPNLGYPIIQGAVPESIFSLDPSDRFFSETDTLSNYNALGIGPGIGTRRETTKATEAVFRNFKKPMVIDADALNILAQNKDMLNMLPENSILTPHPKEFDRIFGVSDSGYKRNQLQIGMAKKHQVIIVLKGAYTSIALPNGTCCYNSTGNPGMATAGSGDVLTGIILSLLAQGHQPDEAAIIGTYIHGHAGDLAAKKTGHHALIASDMIHFLYKAFKKLEKP